MVAHTPPYEQDSLRWVAAEVRFPRVEEFEGGIPGDFHRQIRDHFPIAEDASEVALSVGPAGPSAQQTLRRRFVRRDRLMSVTVSREAVALESTTYDGWMALRELFVESLRALDQVRRPDGITRVGLRYIDEIRVPEPPAEPAAWAGWVDDRLVAPSLMTVNGNPTNATIVLQFGQPPGYVTLFRAAPFASGRSVQAEGVLRMPFETPDGPYFLLDTDASWTDPEGLIPEFDVGELTNVLNRLHEPCIGLFESSIGPRLRDEVLTRPREEVWD
jgi:uncharacterized protein (TIGR04255 family)